MLDHTTEIQQKLDMLATEKVRLETQLDTLNNKLINKATTHEAEPLANEIAGLRIQIEAVQTAFHNVQDDLEKEKKRVNSQEFKMATRKLAELETRADNQVSTFVISAKDLISQAEKIKKTCAEYQELAMAHGGGVWDRIDTKRDKLSVWNLQRKIERWLSDWRAYERAKAGIKKS